MPASSPHDKPSSSTSPRPFKGSVGPVSPGSSLSRSFNPNDPDQRERQMAQDLESAMAISRARSNSMVSPSLLPSSALTPPPMSSRDSHTSHHSDHPEVHRSHSHSHPRRLSRAPSQVVHEDAHFPMLSEQEEADMSRARGHGPYTHEDAILEQDGEDVDPVAIDYADRVRRSIGDESSHPDEDDDVDRRMRDVDDNRSIGASTAAGMMTMGSMGQILTGMGGGFVGRNHFDYSHLEKWAQEEKVSLGIASDISRAEGAGAQAGFPGMITHDEPREMDSQESELIASPGSMSPSGSMGVAASSVSPPPQPLHHITHPSEETAFVRRRQRKLSQSNPAPAGRRQGKLALFEGGGAAGATSSPLMGHASILGGPAGGSMGVAGGKASSPLLPTTSHDSGGNYSTFPKPPFFDRPSQARGAPTPSQPAQERPYRFSFYSNALPSTIHARSLSELPADGQSFEDLFTGKALGEDVNEDSVKGSGTATPINIDHVTGAGSGLLSRAIGNARNGLNGGNGGGGGGATPAARSEDPEASTWWLDVLCPTDEEMRMLSKVFGIHPLTTEDIQMEETREKIELFRNYYLVCFRSFDQDPYSQTHLEPLNMYIIVFREGTLSFHFRGTPHPQNVRRRIKQLKDYISVTSDWISYALIDDITDAFGPLIQSIEYEVDSIDELVLILKEAEQSDMLRRIGTCRKKVMGLLRLMGNKADVVKGLAKRCNESWSVAPKSDIGLYLSDIQDHLITMTQNLNHYEKILSRSHSNYLAQISIEMTDANNQTNDVLSRMTALGTVLIPMNIVTGLWGMNVQVPGQEVQTNLHWFFGIVGCLAAFALLGTFLTYRIFKTSS